MLKRMESNNNKFAELVKNCESQPLYFLTEKNAELIELLHQLHGNRPVKEDRVRSLVNAIREGVYIPPILVAVPSRQVIEGNHRLAAMHKCLEQNIPFKIGMITCKDLDALETARVINNTQVRWTANNRLHSYCVEGKRSFLQLRDFMDSRTEYLKSGNNYKIISTLSLFVTSRPLRSLQQSFYKGTLSLKKEDFDKAELVYNELKIIQTILPTLNVFGDDAIVGWVKARQTLKISTDEFFRKLKKKARTLEQPKRSTVAWFDLFSHVAIGL